MRSTLIGWAAALTLAVTAAAVAAGPPTKTVYLFGVSALEDLRQSNPAHYERARRILAAAKQLCRPGPPETYFASADARDILCLPSFLRTSDPPQEELSFTLDDTRYVALVFVIGPPPMLKHAH